MVVPDDRVWQRFFTPAMSAFFQHHYEERGVRFVQRARVTGLAGDGAVSTVVTDAGRMLLADLVVAGIGVTPATDALVGAGLELSNGVVVNEYLETSAPGVYAAGDVANYYDVRSGRRRRVEHWDNAVEQGRHAARALMGERAPFVHVPYFFSDVFDLSYECWGDPTGADEVAYRGNLESGSFSVWWLREERLVAAFVMNRPEEEREGAPRWVMEGRSASALFLDDEPRPGCSMVGHDRARST
jgi:NADPH-dependent 2,4-dienoyl-CoA reductase/sulfur reductase-like enzyme